MLKMQMNFTYCFLILVPLDSLKNLQGSSTKKSLRHRLDKYTKAHLQLRK